MGGAQKHCTQTKRTSMPFSHLGKLKKGLKCTLDNAVQQAVVQWFRNQSNSLQRGQTKMCIQGAPVHIPVTCILTVAVASTVSILERISFIHAA